MLSHNKKPNLILGIETSCDETALALYQDSGLLDDIVYSQIEDHQQYGGVVPELAAREHLGKIDILLAELLNRNNLTPQHISHVAYTKGPGLIGALLVGANYALGLAKALQCPLIGVNHLEAHIVTPFMNDTFPNKPFLTLLVSGGHSQIIYTHGFGEYEIIGESVDDAVGEAFDKTAKIMGLGYPGGPVIEKLAKQSTSSIDLPRPMLHSQSAMLSFSGLKTATRLAYEKQKDKPNIKADIAFGLQQSICETLVHKLKFAIKKTNAKHLVVSGGVSANQALRKALETLPVELSFPAMKYCTDNGAMVAYLGYLRRNDPPPSPKIQSRWRIDTLTKN